MVAVAVLGVGTLGGKIIADLALSGHTVRAWDSDGSQLDAFARRRLPAEKEELAEEGLMMHKDFLGRVYCFDKLEEALLEAELVLEAVVEDVQVKQDLFEKVSHVVRPKVVLATNSLSLDLDEIFTKTAYKERCLGMRYLYPVVGIPEVELKLAQYTTLSAVEFCLDFLGRNGKTGYFSSGRGPPVVLSEEQRKARLDARKRFMQINRTLAGKEKYVLPELAHAGNFAPVQDDPDATAASSLALECVICMDGRRACVLRPCQHLCSCAHCGRMLVERRDACPICRTDITDIVEFYRS